MYNIMKLNYDYSDLEPYIDTHTVGLHYNKHYRKSMLKIQQITNFRKIFIFLSVKGENRQEFFSWRFSVCVYERKGNAIYFSSIFLL